jgi:hypothetical protein
MINDLYIIKVRIIFLTRFAEAFQQSSFSIGWRYWSWFLATSEKLLFSNLANSKRIFFLASTEDFSSLNILYSIYIIIANRWKKSKSIKNRVDMTFYETIINKEETAHGIRIALKPGIPPGFEGG